MNYVIKNLKKQLKNGALNVTEWNISSLTDDNNPGILTDSDDESLNSKAITTSSYSDASNDCSTLKLKDNSNLFVPSNVIASKKKTVEQGGHPKGATDAAVKELQQNVELAT